MIRCRRLSPVVWRMQGLLPAPRCELTCLLQSGPGRVAPTDVWGWGRALLLTVGMSQSFWCKLGPGLLHTQPLPGTEEGIRAATWNSMRSPYGDVQTRKCRRAQHAESPGAGKCKPSMAKLLLQKPAQVTLGEGSWEAGHAMWGGRGLMPMQGGPPKGLQRGPGCPAQQRQ